MQTTLLQPPQLEPLPADQGSYVPSLLDRSGERDALAQTHEDVWARMTPILHFLGPTNPNPDLKTTRFTNWSKRMMAAVGQHPFYLDISRLSPLVTVETGKGSVPILDRLYESMRKRDARFMPVVPVDDRFEASLNSTANCAIRDGHGLAIRYRFRDLVANPGMNHTIRLSEVLDKLKCDSGKTDLLIDAGYIDPDDEFDVDTLANDIQAMISVAEWRTVTFLGTSIPATMSEVKEGTTGRIDRREWALWKELTTKPLPRPIAFGDYGIQHPKPPSGGGPSMRRNIRYTTPDETIVARAFGRFTDSDADQYRELCVGLKAMSEFQGRPYSWGDEIISDCADGVLMPGEQEMWRGAGTAHHLQAVSDQLRGA